MFCVSCGQSLTDDARFCSKCGRQVQQELELESAAVEFDSAGPVWPSSDILQSKASEPTPAPVEETDRFQVKVAEYKARPYESEVTTLLVDSSMKQVEEGVPNASNLDELTALAESDEDIIEFAKMQEGDALYTIGVATPVTQAYHHAVAILESETISTLGSNEKNAELALASFGLNGLPACLMVLDLANSKTIEILERLRP